MINLIIVSDIKLYREGLAEILNRKDSICIVGVANNVENAIMEIHAHTPDIVLIDMTMIACNDVVTHIASSCPGTKIVALAVAEDEDTIFVCAKAGIAGYVPREASIKQLINTVYSAVEGNELYCPRKIAASLFHKLESLHSVNEDVSQIAYVQPAGVNEKLLTRRELQIAKEIINGFSNKQIARNLSIEISTVKNHVHNILVKMGVGTRMQAANILLTEQII